MNQKQQITKQNKKNNKKKNKTLTDIKLTKAAKERIDELKNENKDVFIRVMIISGGCAGKQYYILMDDYIGETDLILRKRNAKYHENLPYIIIDEASLEYLHNIKIDYSEGLEFAGFKIDNPNIQGTCSCGNSFTCDNCPGGVVPQKEECQTNKNK